jgi:hypothetical protein
MSRLAEIYRASDDSCLRYLCALRVVPMSSRYSTAGPSAAPVIHPFHRLASVFDNLDAIRHSMRAACQAAAL